MKTPILLLTTLLLTTLCPLGHATQADETTIVLTGQNAGPSPFIKKLSLTVSDLAALDRIQFAITPKQGSVTRPLSATYTRSYLAGRGYVNSQSGQITVPVFGLYDAYANNVKLTYYFNDGSSRSVNTTVATPPYDDPCGYKGHTVFKARTASTALSYDFILITSNCSLDSPTVVDTDGAIRWVGTAGVRHYVSTFHANGIYLANLGLLRIELDGEVTRVADKASLDIVGLHHSIDPGKYGMILDVDTTEWVESVNIEIDRDGNVLKKWSLGDIIRQEMIAGGQTQEEVDEFVRNANGRYDYNAYEDWFHNNAVTYRRSDDSLIISSRENFVICIDYESGAIKWILGDPTKQWYQYQSLRKYALALTPGGHYPIGQHTVNVTRDNHLLLFDNGMNSAHHIPRGARRGYAASRKYSLDLEARTATEVWNFENNQSIGAPFRSSVYEDASLNYLINYDVGPQRVLGLEASGEVVFDYRFPGAGFRSLPVHWENLTFPATDARLGNISARSQLNTGDEVGITGFIATGPGPKGVLMRGLGPSLQVNGQPVAGRLMNPLLELHNSDGTTLQINDDYKNSPNAAAVAETGLAPGDDREAAIIAQLAPGAYTAILRGAGNTTGIGLAEVFDIAPQAPSKLANLSARALTATGDRVLIGGLIVEGSTQKRVLFRGIGPELGSRGVANALQNPTLDIYGADGVKIASNDDWRQASNAGEIAATGIAPVDDREAAILMPLLAGNYTFIVRGAGDTQGIAAVEAYRLD